MTLSLTVLSVAYPFAPVGVDVSGGAEQILAMIDGALVESGHRSIVLACSGSQTAGELIPGPPVAERLNEPACKAVRAHYSLMLEQALRERKPDLVHMHGVDFASYLPLPGPPVLATLHLPPSYYPAEALAPNRPRTYLNCVSAIQRASCSDSPSQLAPIPNGIRLDSFTPSESKEDFVLALGRICPEKGYHLALDAAKAAGARLLLAGQLFPYETHERYFVREIAPRLDDRRRYIGHVGLARK
jgi:glycosyltransferase involved in cell wall biosynthesis